MLRRRGFGLLLLFPLWLQAGCVPEIEKGPKIVFDETSFSSQPTEGQIQHRFYFRNAGTEELQILKAASSCGCMVPQVGNRELKPGESSYIEARFNVISQRRQASVWVHSNDPKQPTIELVLEATGKLPNEFGFLPNSIQLNVQANEVTKAKCLLRYSAWKNNDPAQIADLEKNAAQVRFAQRALCRS